MQQEQSKAGSGPRPKRGNTENSIRSRTPNALRRRAEQTLRAEAAQTPKNLGVLVPKAARQVLHELQVRQIEIEMQNEELRGGQAELEASRARYFDLYDLAPVGYFTLSEPGLILDANLTAATLLRVARGALARQLLSRFVRPEDQGIYRRHRTRLLETGAPQVCELRLVKEDGTQFWVHLEATMAPDADGAPICRVVISDISALKAAAAARQQANDELEQRVAARTEELRRANEALRTEIMDREQAVAELRESEVRFRSIVETANEGIWYLTPDFRIKYVNRAITAILGYTPAEIVGRPLLDLVPEDERTDSLQRMADRREGGHDTFERHYRRRDGSLRTVLVSAAPVIDANGALAGSFAMLTDITERKWAEAATRASEARLRQLIAELSRVEDRERQRLATCLHDDLGQTLAVVRMKFGALRAAVDCRPLTKAIDEIHDLLETSIDQTHSLAFDLSPPVLHQLGLEAAVEWAGEKIGRDHGLEFEFRDDGESKPLGDEQKAMLFRCVRELMLNVAKHAQARRLTAAVRRQADQLCVMVQDDGCGFDVSRLDCRRGEVGFGLLSVRERLGTAGGRFEIESAPGKGTRVTLTIPVSR